MLFFFPDTKGVPLEEIAAIFGDADEVAIYQRDIEIDHTTHDIITHDHDRETEKVATGVMEDVKHSETTDNNV